MNEHHIAAKERVEDEHEEEDDDDDDVDDDWTKLPYIFQIYPIKAEMQRSCFI